MILYIDETENEKYFIVAGLLVDSPTYIEKSYKSFKKSINRNKINFKYKSQLFTEFKSSLLDNDYQSIKVKMLKTISAIPGAIVYSCYIKKTPRINQALKETTYISLLSSIIGSIKCECDIVFDSFNKSDFELNIKKSALKHKNVKSIAAKDSQLVHGLQFIDNICSVIRLYKTHGLKSDKVKLFYPLIKKMVKEIK